ncbi:MAG: class I SAM-dependent methyltransferase [Halioglobus sp.]
MSVPDRPNQSPITTQYQEVAQPSAWFLDALTDADCGNDEEFAYNALELPLPNTRLRTVVSGPDLGRFLYIGHAWASVCTHYLPPAQPVLVMDIGCGVGKMARFFALDPAVHYVGFDIYRPAITWCRREFSRLYGERFRFEHFDGRSAMYNPGGSLSVADYRFPAADGSVDLALGASLFTHLYENDMRHYLAETARVLKTGGLALLSIHTLDELPEFFPDAPAAGDRKIVGNEQVILVDRDYFVALAGESGLTLHALPGRLCGQELVVVQKI